jgi:hypothetical protein
VSQTIDAAFITQWTAEVHHDFQQRESHLRSAVRVVNGVNANVYKFHKLGAGTATSNKARYADLNPMDVDHSTVSATLTSIHAMEPIDDLDTYQINFDARMEYQRAVTGAISRELDSRIVTALATTSNSVTTGSMDAAKIAALQKALNKKKVPLDGKRFLVISPGALEDMINDTKIANNDYLAKTAFEKGFVSGVMGFNVIVMTDETLLPQDTASKRTCFAFHQSAVGLAIGADFQVRWDYVPQKDTWQLLGKMLAGAVAIDTNGIVKVEIDD